MNNPDQAEQAILAAGMKIVTRAEFDAATDVHYITREIARRVFAQWGGAFVIYDPTSDGDGWLLIDDDRALLVRETAQYLREQQTEPDLQPSLF